jgi:hypothetical protein
MFKKDNFAFGTMLGSGIPILFYLIFSAINKAMELKLQRIIFEQNTIFVLCIVANLIPFRQYMQKGYYEQTGKGILLVTFIYAFIYMYVKFLR